MDSQNQDNLFSQIPGEIKTFLESILQDAGMTSLEPKMHDEMVKELFQRLDNYMLTTIVDSLNEKDLEEFTKMAENNTPRDELEKYLKTHVENADEVFTQAMLDFREAYLGNVEAANTQVANA